MSTRQALSALETAGLIGLAQAQPELAYAFRHALVQDAAYASLVRRSRQALHQAAGETLEALFPEADGRDAHLAELAHHFFEAEAWEKALDYAWRAGRAAQGRFAAAEAIALFDRAVAAAARLGRLPPPDLLRARGQAHETVGAFAAARAAYEAGLSAARAAGDARREWQGLLDLGFLWASQDYAQTGGYFRQALALAERLGDAAALAHSLNRVGNWYVNVESPREGLSYHRRALEIFQRLGDEPGRAQTLDLIALTELERGALASGAAYYARAIELFRALGDRQGMASALCTYASAATVSYIHDTLPVIDAAGQPAVEGLAVARAIGWRSGEAFGLMQIAYALGPRGEFGRALAAARQGEAVAREIGHQQWLAGVYLALGGLHLDLLDPTAAHRYLLEADRLARQVGSLLFQRHLAAQLALAHVALAAEAGVDDHHLAEAERRLAESLALGAHDTLAARQMRAAQVELALARGRPELALRLLDALRETPDGALADGAVPRLDWLRGRALAALGRPQEAERLLALAEAGAVALELRCPLWRIRLARSRALAAQGQGEAAAAALARARAAVDEVAGRTEPGALRDRFIRQAERRLQAAG